MKLTIFPEGDTLGRELVAQAVAAGHEVTVVVGGLPGHAGLDPAAGVVAGDAADLATVRPAVFGRDAVLCTLVHGNDPRYDVLARATENMVAGLSLNSTGGRRLVVLSS